MCNRSANVPRQQGSHTGGGSNDTEPDLNEEEVTNQFRDYLIYGNTKEALG